MTLTIRYVEATGTDQGERLGRYPLQDGDVVIADRGYHQPEAILRLREQAIHGVIRLNPWAMSLYQRTGERLDLVEHLQRVATEHHCLPVWLGVPGRACEGWVHAYRLAPAEAEAARRRCRRNAQGGTPSARTLFLAGGVLVLTTVPPHVLGTETVMALYRLRWQAELAIKRLKSVLDLDQLRAKQGSPLADVWLHGKLLYALVIEKYARSRVSDDWSRLERQRPATWWRVWKIIRREVAEWIIGVL
jgi:Transposase DDE domain